MESVKVMVLGLLICLICIFCLIVTLYGAGGFMMAGIGYYGFFVGVIVTLAGICMKDDKENKNKI